MKGQEGEGARCSCYRDPRECMLSLIYISHILVIQARFQAEWYNYLGFKTIGKIDIYAPTGTFPAYFFIREDETQNEVAETIREMKSSRG